MLMCEVKIEETWETVSATQLPRGTCSPQIRCTHCHGAVRIHKAWTENSPRDHFEHRVWLDSKGCLGGIYHDPKLGHRMSMTPIE